MKILFYYRETEQLGIEYLSSILKKAGHKTELIFEFGMPRWATNSNIFNFRKDRERLLKKAEKFNPDLLAFSSDTYMYSHVRNMNALLKKKLNIPSIIGGIHATSLPQFVLNDGFDYVCIGEGEEAVLELVNKLEDNKDTSNIKNIWLKKNNKIIKNPLRPLIQNLDSLPFPDRDLFYKYGVFKDNLMVMASRGCPYNCAYCHNSSDKKLYPNQRYTRKRSVDNVFEEINLAKKKYNIKRVEFEDETFTIDMPWLREFAKRYPKEIGIPFFCQTNPNNVTEENIRLIKEAGCPQMYMGIDSGDDHIRNNILKRGVQQKQMIKAAKIIKDAGLKLQVTAMFAIPHETPEAMWRTVDLIEKIKPDASPTYTLFPFPQTDIYYYALKKKMLDEKTILDIKQGKSSDHDVSILKHPYKNTAYNISKLLSLYLRTPGVFKPLIKKKMLSNKKSRLSNYVYLFLLPFDYPFYAGDKIKAFLKAVIRNI